MSFPCIIPCHGTQVDHGGRSQGHDANSHDDASHGVTTIARRDSMDMGTTLMVSVLFSSIGTGYFIYGKKQRQVVPLLTGLALCVYPYFLSNGYAIVVVGILLTAVPWLIRL